MVPDTLCDLLLVLCPVVIIQKQPIRTDQVDQCGVIHDVVSVLIFGSGSGIHPVVPPRVSHLLGCARQSNHAGVKVFDVLGQSRHVVPLWVHSDEEGLDWRQRGVPVQSRHHSTELFQLIRADVGTVREAKVQQHPAAREVQLGPFLPPVDSINTQTDIEAQVQVSERSGGPWIT